jgi:peptidyl-prolyl cis-trans isomerase SurA
MFRTADAVFFASDTNPMSPSSRASALQRLVPGALAAAVFAWSCAHAQTDTPAAPAAAPAAPAAVTAPAAKPAPKARTPILLDRIVAVVNDEAITARELDERAGLAMKQLAQQGTSAPPKAVIERQLLERMIGDRVQVQFAKESGVRVDDADLERAIRTRSAWTRCAPLWNATACRTPSFARTSAPRS